MKKIKLIALMSFVFASVVFLSACSLLGGEEQNLPEPTPVTITLNATGGTNETQNGWTWNQTNGIFVKVLNSGSQIGTLPVVTRQNYIFEGWFTDLVEGTQINSALTVPNSSKVYYARWSVPAKMVTITLNLDGGQAISQEGWVYSQQKLTKVIEEGTTFGNLPVPTKTEYIFGGWAASSSSLITSSSIVPTSNTTYTAIWTEASYSVGEQNFQTLAQAVTAANLESTITVLKSSVSVNNGTTIVLNKNITLMPKLNVDISLTNLDSAIFSLNGATLTLKGNGTGRLLLGVADRSYDPMWNPGNVIRVQAGSLGNSVVLQAGVYFDYHNSINTTQISVSDQRFTLNVPIKNFNYTGSVIYPNYTVIDNFTNQVITSSNYTVSGTHGTSIGSYTLRVTFNNVRYFGTAEQVWNINRGDIGIVPA